MNTALDTDEASPRQHSRHRLNWGTRTPTQTPIDFHRMFQLFPRDGDPGRIAVNALLLDAFTIAQFKCGPVSMMRERRAEGSGQRFWLILCTKGHLDVSIAGKPLAAFSEQFYVVPPGRERLTFKVPEYCEGMLFSFHRGEVEPLRPEAARLREETLKAPLGRASFGYLKGILDSEGNTIGDDTTTLRTLIREVARGIVRTASATDPANECLFESAQWVLQAEFTNPGFNAGQLAQRLGVSRSTLDRAYAMRGCRIAQEIRRARAEYAKSRLEQYPSWSRSLVAHSAGFGSGVSLRRALDEFDLRPER